MSDALDVTPLANAHASRRGLARYQLDIKDAQIRDGLIQRFAFTYEISQKTLKRYLESVTPSPGEHAAMPFADIIGSANEQGLLRTDWVQWKLIAKCAANFATGPRAACSRPETCGHPSRHQRSITESAGGRPARMAKGLSLNCR